MFLQRLTWMYPVATALTVGLSLSACESYDLGSEQPTTLVVNAENPTWENGIGALVTAKCANCHKPMAERSQFVPADTPNSTSLNNIRLQTFFTDASNAALLNVLYNRVFNDTESPMPPTFSTPLSANEKDAFKTYLSSKVSSTDTQITTLCGTTGTSDKTYATATGALVNTYCATSGCHGSAQTPLLNTLALVKTNRALMISDIKTGKMPLGNTTFATTDDGKTLFNWLCFGSDVK